MTVQLRDIALVPILVAVLVAVLACEVRSPEPGPVTEDTAPPSETPVRSPWHTVEASSQIGLPEGVVDEDLEAAVRKARGSVESARRRWAAAPPEARVGWAVKWSAPTIGGPPEHVWVVPLAWSRFRVEGTLASPPAAPLECGRELGELASFPIEELADWVRYENAEFTGAREGGFTIDVLEERFGEP